MSDSRLTQRLLWLCLAPLVVVVPSCGGASDNAITLYPTSGQVLFQGKPLADVQLVFRPVGADPSTPTPVPIGQTDSEGKYRLSTSNGAEARLADGAPAGEYLVGISTPRRSDSVNFLSKDAPKFTASPLSNRYADPKTSGLKATIKPGSNTIDPFDLNQSGGASTTPVGEPGRGR